MAKNQTAKKEKKSSGKTKDSNVLKVEDIRSKTLDERKDLVLSMKREQFNNRFQKLAGEATKSSKIRAIRKNIARIKTVMNENKNNNKGATNA